MNEWDPVKKVITMLKQAGYDVPSSSLKFLGVSIRGLDPKIRFYDITAAFNVDVLRLSVELDVKALEIIIRTMAGKNVLIEVESTGTIDEIKQRFKDKEGTPPDSRIGTHSEQLTFTHGFEDERRGILPYAVCGRVVEEWNTAAPNWWVACQGLNLEGLCPNEKCVAFDQMVICEAGFGVTNAALGAPAQYVTLCSFLRFAALPIATGCVTDSRQTAHPSASSGRPPATPTTSLTQRATCARWQVC